MRFLCMLVCLLYFTNAWTQPEHYFYHNIDVQHYTFALRITDSSNTIEGIADIDLRKKTGAKELVFDLAGKTPDGKGMTISSVLLQGHISNFKHELNQLHVPDSSEYDKDSLLHLQVYYSGIPADGLIISTNKYGHRTFFGDNWPNRAHQWLPCNDHPSDKATVTFRVLAPDHYQVVSNGLQTERTNNGNGYTLTEWTENFAIPTKVMVIGLAGFSVGYAGSAGSVPVYSWVFPEDHVNGFFDYGQATSILPFFMDKVGPYPFAKLANVQSKTIFGGMENAGCIFYYENSVNGKRREEPLLAHEIAHQWFGNSATEISWQHLWLSEGFATYMTDAYMEKQYGTDTLQAMLKEQRLKVINFHKVYPGKPVIDSMENKLMNLLNANSYQKGGWVLHMLRRNLGDDQFWNSISTYYSRFAGKNASTDDFRSVCEEISHKDLRLFFYQWLRQPEIPGLFVSWKSKPNGQLEIYIRQMQEYILQFPLEISIKSTNGIISKTFNITGRKSVFTLPVADPVVLLTVDPNTNLLAEWTVKRVK
ncbi:M1 family metallopeptidase [Flavihumibacter profundi]|jgi:aminopeptidase N|uniref:M1 family metallopeptidase n=1 Tax=Flavihumibacter profundi TaxID=2716883 RepID=UPI001CC70938|nr:M1 family metallopeptidase [Flavihumibacter profundi]MBZ5858197.1 M1 family metallopeptidase [Flavihumibacter profundi]